MSIVLFAVRSQKYFSCAQAICDDRECGASGADVNK